MAGGCGSIDKDIVMIDTNAGVKEREMRRGRGRLSEVQFMNFANWV
jgi:hypothetical protein